jgi:methyl-accepting chemotaxis protein
MRIKSLAIRLYGLGLVGLFFLLVLAAVSVWFLYEEKIDSKIEKSRSIAEASASIVRYYAQKAEQGELSREQAQTKAKEILRATRYDGTNYVFGQSFDGTILAHGTRPEIEGRVNMDDKDPTGLPFARELVRRAQEGGGWLRYQAIRPGTQNYYPKISYADPAGVWDWSVVTGVFIDDVQREFLKLLLRFSALVAGMIAIVFVVAARLARSISRPIKELAEATATIAQGDYSIAIPAIERADELGQLANAIQVLRDEAAQAEKIRRERETEKARAQQERAAILQGITTKFETIVRSVLETIALKVEENDTTAAAMNKTAEEAAQEALSVEAASQEVTSNVQMVASAAEELSSSVAEIAQQTQVTRTICSDAVTQAEDTDRLMHGLAEAVDHINEVVHLINDIADQTNLLALNATIEAARAGDAGKGFAVVAGEVKSLANQTAKATGDIEQQINAVRTETEKAVGAIGEISRVIGRINEVNASVAASVEEQASATQEISRSVQQASTRATNVSDFIGSLTKVMNEVGESAGLVSIASSVVKGEMGTLYEHVEEFLAEIKKG